MKGNKGFTLIELLAVILILGIIALIAIPTVNSILKESRTGAWKSTASQMTKAAENYFQLKQIKNEAYVMNFKTGQASSGYVAKKTSGGTIEIDAGATKSGTTVTYSTGYSAPSAEELYKFMLGCLSLKGDIPKDAEISLFQINQNGAVALVFENSNAQCMTVDGTSFTAADYTAVKSAIELATQPTFDSTTNKYGETNLMIGGTAVCNSK